METTDIDSSVEGDEPDDIFVFSSQK